MECDTPESGRWNFLNYRNRNNGRGFRSFRLHLQNGVCWGLGLRLFLFQDEDPLARQ